MYAESIAYTPGQLYDVAKSESESVKMLSAAAQETGAWLIGGYELHLPPDRRLNRCQVQYPRRLTARYTILAQYILRKVRV